MITVRLVGKDQMIAKLDALPESMRKALRKKISMLSLTLESLVKQKLSGQVLQVRTGALRASIHHELIENATSITGVVFSTGSYERGKQPIYATIQEYGGTTKPHIILPVKAKALAFMKGGKMVFASKVNHPGSKIPARSYMRSSLLDMKQTIRQGLDNAVQEGLHNA